MSTFFLVLWLVSFDTTPSATAASRQGPVKLSRAYKSGRLHAAQRLKTAPHGQRKKQITKTPVASVRSTAPANDIVVTSDTTDTTVTTVKPKNRADQLATRIRTYAARSTSPVRQRRLQRLADNIEYLFGFDTMNTASLELTIAFILKVPGLAVLGNAAFQIRRWFPSHEYRRIAAAQQLNEPIWGYSAGAGTVLGGTGYDSVTGFYMPGVSERGYGTGLGIPHYVALGFGEVNAIKPGQYKRGPYIGASAQVIPLGIGGVSVEGTLYYKPVERLTRRLRPIFDAARQLVVGAFEWVTGKRGISRFNRPGAGVTDVSWDRKPAPR